MPKAGEVRHGSTESVQWDGSRWRPMAAPASVDTPRSFGWLDNVPGLRDVLNLPENLVKGAQALPDVARGLVHDPAATLKGFAQGTSEAATPGRIGMLALLASRGATLPATLAAVGGETLAQGTRVATDAPNAPKSFPEAAGSVLEAGAVPLTAGALKTVPAGVERLGGSRKVAGAVLGAGVGGYEGYRYGGIPGAIAGAVGGGKLGGGSLSMRGLRSVIGGGASEDVASDVAPDIVDQYRPNRSGYGKSSEVKGFSMPTETPAAEPMPRSVMSDVEPYMPNRSGYGDAPASEASTSHIPYAAQRQTPSYSGPVGKLAGKAPKLEDSLIDALNSARNSEPTASMRGLEEAIKPTSDDPAAAVRDDAVRRYLARFSGLPTDEEVAARTGLRNATGTWPKN